MLDLANPRHRELFFTVHQGLPREAPGSVAITLQALALTNTPTQAHVLDIGCGTGHHTLTLSAALPGAHVTGLDAHQPYLDVLKADIAAKNMKGRVDAMLGDMRAPPFPDSAFDLLWCEAAVYVMGFERAMARWRQLLKDGGYLALSDLVWLSDERPQQAIDYWASYVDMTTIPNRQAQIASLGYTNIDAFVMPPSAWTDEYYDPMQARIDMLTREHQGDEEALAVLEAIGEEIRVFEGSTGCYGYAFFVARRLD
jgi:SAM-dependent methyltransferase